MKLRINRFRRTRVALAVGILSLLVLLPICAQCDASVRNQNIFLIDCPSIESSGENIPMGDGQAREKPSSSCFCGEAFLIAVPAVEKPFHLYTLTLTCSRPGFILRC